MQIPGKDEDLGEVHTLKVNAGEDRRGKGCTDGGKWVTIPDKGESMGKEGWEESPRHRAGRKRRS